MKLYQLLQSFEFEEIFPTVNVDVSKCTVASRYF